MNRITPIAAFLSLQLLAAPHVFAGDYSLLENVTPGALVTSSFGHYEGGRGITPFYGYYTIEIPTMNSDNVIVGRVDKANSTFPMVKNAGEAAKWINGTLTTLGVYDCKDADQNGLPDNSVCGSRALSINDAGQIGGASHDWLPARDTYFEKSYMFIGNGVFTNPYFNFSSQSQVQDINSRGDSVGTGITVGGGWPFDGMSHGSISPASGSDTIVGTTYQTSQAHALNSFGMATGSVKFNAENTYTYNTTTPQYGQVYRYNDDIRFGGFLPGGTFSVGYDINDNGIVVGLAVDSTGQDRAFLWNSKYVEGETHYLSKDKYGNFTNLTNELESFLQDIGTLKSDNSGDSLARSVNNHDQIVGWSETDTGETHAFIYENSVMQDLNSLVPNLNGWILVDAYKVTEKGHILVRGTRGFENSYMIVSPSIDLPVLTITEWTDFNPYDLIPSIPEISSLGPQDVAKALSADYYVCNAQCKTDLIASGATTATMAIANNAFLTIQSAINASSTNQAVMVLPGVYNENIVIDKDIIVESWKGAGATIIDATSVPFVSTVEMKYGTVDGFTITGGTGFSIDGIWNTFYSYGGGVIMMPNYSIDPLMVVKNNVITGNRVICPAIANPCISNGDALFVNELSNAVINNNIISNNGNSGSQSSIIYLYSVQDTSIHNNVFSNNTGNSITGQKYNARTHYDSNLFTLNTGSTFKPWQSGYTTVSNSLIIGNKTGNVVLNTNNYVTTDGYFRIYNSTIAYNGDVDNGGNAFVLKSGNVIENSILWGNPHGSGIYSNGYQISGNATVRNSIVDYGYDPVYSINVIDVDPQFVDAEGGDFTLTAASPGIDTGSDLTSIGITTDVTGAPRPVDGNGNGVAEFDMGAFEQ